MIRINLLPTRELRALRRKRRTLMAGAAALLLAGIALAAINVSQARRQAALESELAGLRQTVGKLRLDATATRKLEEENERQRLKNSAVSAWLARRARHPGVLSGLSSAAPDTLWLTRYAESEGTTVLEGLGTDDASIARFVRSLAGIFKSRQLVEAGKAPGEAGVRRFVIHARTGMIVKDTGR